MPGSNVRSRIKESYGGLVAPMRNRFFHGKKLDVYHFELETAYGIEMRRLINRYVVGRGVVCGLDVTACDDPCSIQISPGFAIDGRGREIIVPSPSGPIPIPYPIVAMVCDSTDDKEQSESKDDYRESSEPGWLTVSICYHECAVGPVSTNGHGCGPWSGGEAGSIRENYRIEFTPGQIDPVDHACSDLMSSHGVVSPAEIAKLVTRGCCDFGCDPCIPLAVLKLTCGDVACEIDGDSIDITVRPVVITNPVIFGVGCLAGDADDSDQAKAH